MRYKIGDILELRDSDDYTYHSRRFLLYDCNPPFAVKITDIKKYTIIDNEHKYDVFYYVFNDDGFQWPQCVEDLVIDPKDKIHNRFDILDLRGY